MFPPFANSWLSEEGTVDVVTTAPFAARTDAVAFDLRQTC